MSEKPPYEYVLDDDTLELLETVMNYAQRHIDCQESDEHFEDMNQTLLALADRFNIQRNNIEYEEKTSDDGSHVTIKMRIVQDGETRQLTPEERRKMIKVVKDVPHPDGEIIDIDINGDDDEPTKH